MSKSMYKSTISDKIYSLVDNISDRQFFDVFNANKEDVLNKIILDEETGRYTIPQRSKIIKEKCLVYDTLIKLENLVSLEEIEDIKDEKYYDFYNIAINPSSFYYIDTFSDNAADGETILEDSDIKKIEKIFSKINRLDSFHNLSSSTIFKKSTMTIDNFNLVFEVEVL